MALYNLSDFLSMIKENVLGDDLPSPVPDKDLIRRFERSALRSFSQVYPRIKHFIIGEEFLVDQGIVNTKPYYEYKIPPYVYEGAVIISLVHIDVARPNGYSDLYVPDANWTSPDAIVSAVADVRFAASISSSLSKKFTKEFIAPNKVRIYNGWSSGQYDLELLLSHDISLQTIPDDAFIDLEELATLDMEQYLYNRLKRKDGIDTGVGNFQFKIDEWANAGQEKKELLKTWKDEGANLSFQHVERF